MARRAKSPKGKAEPLLARKSPKNGGSIRVRDLEKRLAEALARETATREILRVISQSPTEVQPVFEAIVRSGAALCHAPDVIILMLADFQNRRFLDRPRTSASPHSAATQRMFV